MDFRQVVPVPVPVPLRVPVSLLVPVLLLAPVPLLASSPLIVLAMNAPLVPASVEIGSLSGLMMPVGVCPEVGTTMAASGWNSVNLSERVSVLLQLVSVSPLVELVADCPTGGGCTTVLAYFVSLLEITG